MSLWRPCKGKLVLLAAGGLGHNCKNLSKTPGPQVYYSPQAQTGWLLAGNEEAPEAVGIALGQAGTTIYLLVPVSLTGPNN